jgi:hypothetical protein
MRAKKEPIDINEFIDNHPHPLKKEIREVRKIILACRADITEHIKWNAPSYCYLGDDRITFKLNKNDVVQLVFHSSAKGIEDKKRPPIFVDETKLLDWVADKRALLSFNDMNDIIAKEKDICLLVNKWIEVLLA